MLVVWLLVSALISYVDGFATGFQRFGVTPKKYRTQYRTHYAVAEESISVESKKVKLATNPATFHAPKSIDAVQNAINNMIVTPTGEEFRLSNKITVTSSDHSFVCPDPMISFDSTPFAPQIKATFQQEGFNTPLPTQSQAWPVALSGKDIVTVAKTGSGKTCAFLLPAFHKLLDAIENKQHPAGVPGIVVLAPTRELACQIEQEAIKFGRPLGIRSVCVFGGASKGPQVNTIQRGVEILIATPGRLNDLIQGQYVDLSHVLFSVLDEADRMLDMGFEPQIRSIIDTMTKEHQTMMFSATWPKEVQGIANEFLRPDHVQVKFGDVDNYNANTAIKQTIVMTDPGPLNKRPKLLKILQDLQSNASTTIAASGDTTAAATTTPRPIPKCIIFTATKLDCEQLNIFLGTNGYRNQVGSLHGDHAQYRRDQVMNQFRNNNIRILVATDVAARGLDVKDIDVVINYDFPNTFDNYIHRIGRTARGENGTGHAITLFARDDGSKNALDLIDVLKRSGQEVPQDLVEYSKLFIKSKGNGGGGGGGNFGRFGSSSAPFGRNNFNNFQSKSTFGTGFGSRTNQGFNSNYNQGGGFNSNYNGNRNFGANRGGFNNNRNSNIFGGGNQGSRASLFGEGGGSKSGDSFDSFEW